MNIKTPSVVRPKQAFYKSNNFQAYTIGAIPLLLIFIFNYLPMFGVIIAFKDYRFDKGIFGSEWVGLDNFKMFVSSNDFTRITINTLYLNAIFIAAGIISALIVAILLYEIKSRNATKVYQTLLITPHFLSWVVVSYMAYAFLHPSYGLVNSVIGMFGAEPVDWYSKPEAWPLILTIASVWKHVGMDSVIYYASMMGIDNSLYEVADIEGANAWQKTRYVTLPSLVPLISVLTILKIGSIFRADFGLFYQLTRDIGALYDATDVIDTYIFRTMRVVGDMGVSSAVGLMQSLVGFVLVMLTNYVSKKIEPDNALF
ncbi:MAG: sugar ABC transporter permease [Clostridia bacterium]|nr:sugar ABC transporter permease [Clostridia bacterium]